MSAPFVSDAVSKDSLFVVIPEKPVPARSRIFKIAFTGTGSEYFRIWIVNLLLTIVTLGIYSAWAKVRQTRYLYDNSQLAGSSFEYHGSPIQILKGRILAVVLFGAYNLAFYISAAAGFTMLAILMLALPWLIWRSLQFKLHNSSYRGIRFGFGGTARSAYVAYLFLPILSFLTLWLAAPFVHQRMKKFQHEESRFGTSCFSFHATVGSFYIAYLIGIAFISGGLIVIGIAGAATIAAITGNYGSTPGPNPAVVISTGVFIVATYAWLLTAIPLMLTLLQNLVWNGTRLGGHQFRSELKWTRVMYITLTNMVGIILTLGLFIPFAKIRMLKYRLESISLLPDGSLDEFIGIKRAEPNAAGEGMADLLDFDLSL